MPDQMMDAVAVVGVEQFSNEKVTVPAPGSGEILVKVAYCGICGSDIPRYFEGAVHAFPQVLGHEFSGTVEALGDGVEGLKVGQRVAVAPHIPCGCCEQCRAGNPTLCSDYSFIGSRSQGAMAGYVVAPAVNAVAVGELSLKAAALVEPLTVALHAVNQVEIDPQRPVAILGSGVIGLMTLISLRGRGVTDISVVDVNPWVLSVAQRLGARRIINASSEGVAAAFASEPPAVVLETAGAGPTIGQALEIVARTGSVVYVGKPTRPVELGGDTFEQILRKELTVRGSWLSYSSPFPGSEWSEAVSLLSDPTIDPDELVTHEFGLEEAAEGFVAMRQPGAHRLKVMFRVDGES